MENRLEAGTYVVLVECYFATNFVKDYNVGTYSEERIDLQMIQVSQEDYKQIEYLIWKNYCKTHYNEMEN